MIRRAFHFFHTEIRGLHEAAYLIALASISSQVLALVRDRLLAHTFGAGVELDVYYSAFRVPDLIYATIASFVSVNVLIPFLVKWFGADDSHDSRRAQLFLSNVLTAFMLVMLVVLVIIFAFAPFLARIVAPGFSPDLDEQLTLLMRILLLSPFFLGLSNIIGCVTQSLKRFYLYALSPLVYNLGIIVGILFFYPRWGLPGIAAGVILGGVFHAAVQLPLLRETHVFPRLTGSVDWVEIRKIVRLSFPRTLALGFSQLSLAVLVAIASYMQKGSIAIFNFSFNLFSVPLSLVGASYSVAAFPTLSRLFADGERDRFIAQVTTALRHILFFHFLLPRSLSFFAHTL